MSKTVWIVHETDSSQWNKPTYFIGAFHSWYAAVRYVVGDSQGIERRMHLDAIRFGVVDIEESEVL